MVVKGESVFFYEGDIWILRICMEDLEFGDITSLTVSREPRRDEKTKGYLDFEATKLCPRLNIYVVPV